MGADWSAVSALMAQGTRKFRQTTIGRRVNLFCAYLQPPLVASRRFGCIDFQPIVLAVPFGDDMLHTFNDGCAGVQRFVVE